LSIAIALSIKQPQQKIYMKIIFLFIGIASAILLSNPSKARYMSCEAFARQSGMNLSRDLPCTDSYPTDYPSFKSYCNAMLYQNDIRKLSGCPSEFFDRYSQ